MAVEAVTRSPLGRGCLIRIARRRPQSIRNSGCVAAHRSAVSRRSARRFSFAWSNRRARSLWPAVSPLLLSPSSKPWRQAYDPNPESGTNSRPHQHRPPTRRPPAGPHGRPSPPSLARPPGPVTDSGHERSVVHPERQELVRARGLEPPTPKGPGPKPGAYANFATPAWGNVRPKASQYPELTDARIAARACPG